jgi:hypothetical protein
MQTSHLHAPKENIKERYDGVIKEMPYYSSNDVWSLLEMTVFSKHEARPTTWSSSQHSHSSRLLHKNVFALLLVLQKH